MPKDAGIEFRLTEQEFFSFSNKKCNYCGIELDQVRLDRVNNDLGYEMSNLVPCCKICNKLKHKLTKEIFLSHLAQIYLYQCKDFNDK